MYSIKTMTALVLSISALPAYAEVRYLDEVMAKATSKETQDLGKLLRQIQLVPEKNSDDRKQVMRIVRIEKGSVWDREGLKEGDLIASRNPNEIGQPIELKGQSRREKPADTKKN